MQVSKSLTQGWQKQENHWKILILAMWFEFWPILLYFSFFLVLSSKLVIRVVNASHKDQAMGNATGKNCYKLCLMDQNTDRGLHRLWGILCTERSDACN